MKIKITATALTTAGMLLAVGAPSAANAQESDSYIAVATGGVSAMSADAREAPIENLEAAVENTGGTNSTSYSQIQAVVADMTPTQAAALDAKPGVVVAKDAKVSLVNPAPNGQLKADAGPVPASKVAPASVATSSVATSWGLDRVDQRPAALDGQYKTPAGVNGAGVHAWVFDTGIALSHPEFRGRIGTSYDFVGDGYGANDCDGHGTHVAGTIGSNIFGVAPGATLHSVRVLDCDGSGYWSSFIDALNYVAQVAPAASVANASMGGSYNAAVNAAINNFVVAANMPIAVAAGNSADDVYYYSPASATRATTVAASESGDWDAPYSNYGEEIDLYGPGTDIWSTYYLDPAYKYRMSGTSMATPHVAGYMALYLSAYPTASVAQVEAALNGSATRNVISGTVGGTPNRLVYTSGVPLRAVTVSAAKAGYGNVLAVNVNPDRGAASYAFRVQKRGSTGSWATLSTVYKTDGTAETKAITLGAGTFRALVPAAGGYAAATSAAVTLTAPTVKVTAGTDSAKSKILVNVNPDKGTGYWTFKLQQRRSNGTWATLSTTYKTSGSTETLTIDKGKGIYRVVVAGKYGYLGATSNAVTLAK